MFFCFLFDWLSFKVNLSFPCLFYLRHITKPPTTDNRPPIQQPPAIYHRPTDPSTTDPTTSDQPTSVLPTHRSPTHQQVLQQSTDYWFTNPITTDKQPFDLPIYFKRFTIGTIFSVTDFNSSFEMGTTYYQIRKIISKMIDKKECW